MTVAAVSRGLFDCEKSETPISDFKHLNLELHQ
jgi:hypothetical protein